MANFDDLQGAVAQMGAGNKVIYDDIGMPSIMVGVPKMTYADIITGGTSEVLPFFVVEGNEKNTIWVSKFQNIVENDRAYSLAMKLPKNYITFDAALAACRKKGNGWHLNQTGIFAVLNLLSQKMGTVPHGNTNYGKDHYHTYERGIQPQGETQRTLTGSGEPTWYHNHDTSGIADLNGNVWEWTGGLRLMNGEIQIIPYGNSLVAPGTAGTLKIDRTSASDATPKISTTVTTQTTDSNDTNCIFKNLAAASGVSIPKLLVALGLFPDSGANYGNDHFWARNNGERLPLRGSAFSRTSNSGASALSLDNPRSNSYGDVGFRTAFCEL